MEAVHAVANCSGAPPVDDVLTQLKVDGHFRSRPFRRPVGSVSGIVAARVGLGFANELALTSPTSNFTIVALLVVEGWVGGRLLSTLEVTRSDDDAVALVITRVECLSRPPRDTRADTLWCMDTPACIAGTMGVIRTACGGVGTEERGELDFVEKTRVLVCCPSEYTKIDELYILSH